MMRNKKEEARTSDRAALCQPTQSQLFQHETTESNIYNISQSSCYLHIALRYGTMLTGQRRDEHHAYDGRKILDTEGNRATLSGQRRDGQEINPRGASRRYQIREQFSRLGYGIAEVSEGAAGQKIKAGRSGPPFSKTGNLDITSSPNYCDISRTLRLLLGCEDCALLSLCHRYREVAS